ncbi:MAG: helix-turn-helix domain-containing protein [Pseudomonadota bacterium]
MKSYQPSRSPCPIGRAARVLGDRWVLLIVREIYFGAERFEDFIEPLGINRAALSSRLKMMQEAGLLTREPAEGKRARYVMTERAKALMPVFREMAIWGGEHLFEEGENRTRWPESEGSAPFNL